MMILTTFLNDVIKENEYCSKIFKAKFNKSLVLTKKGHENFNTSIKFWICKKVYEKGEVKVKDHHHVTAKYQGLTHQECNPNLSLSRKTVVFHNVQIMIYIF